MSWAVEYLPEAAKDVASLDGRERILVSKAINKVSSNPLSSAEGGYGKPLGSKGSTDLTGFMKIKLKQAGIRIVYKPVKVEDRMLIIVIGARADDEVYDIAKQRADSHGLK